MSQKDDLSEVMSYEYHLLLQSYKEFTFFILKNKESEKNEIKIHLYNSYAKILHHLYEFLKACVAKEISKTKSEDNSVVARYIVIELEKILNQKGYPVELTKLSAFAEDLRVYRNKVYGHVVKERFDKFPLAEFYQKYHAFIALITQSTEHWWSAKVETLAELKAVQEFSEMLTFGQRS
jgi:hypothetical protein